MKIFAFSPIPRSFHCERPFIGWPIIFAYICVRYVMFPTWSLLYLMISIFIRSKVQMWEVPTGPVKKPDILPLERVELRRHSKRVKGRCLRDREVQLGRMATKPGDYYACISWGSYKYNLNSFLFPNCGKTLNSFFSAAGSMPSYHLS